MSVLLLPDLILPALTDLTPELLHGQGIDLLMMDFDNTIVPYTTSVPTEAMEQFLRALSDAGIDYCVVSNSKKPRVVTFCQKYGIPVFTHAKKPFSRGICQALAAYPQAKHPALVGDQIYTDVLGANAQGLTSILVKPIHLHIWPLKLRHWVELPWIAIRKLKKE